MTDARRLPDFMFFRQPDIEREAGYVLAGRLLTDIPKTSKPSKRDGALIQTIIERLVAGMAGTDQDEAGIWRSGSRPADAADPPFDDEALRKRAARCVVVSVRVDHGPASDGIKIDSDIARQIRGGLELTDARRPQCPDQPTGVGVQQYGASGPCCGDRGSPHQGRVHR